MYGCESWTIKKAECQRIDAFESRCWRKLLRVSWTARRANQSILKEINPECSLEGLLLKLKLQYFGHMMPTANSLEKALMLGKIEGRRRRKQKSMRWLYDIIDSKDMSLRKLQEQPHSCFPCLRGKSKASLPVLHWHFTGSWTHHIAPTCPNFPSLLSTFLYYAFYAFCSRIRELSSWNSLFTSYP